jgi:hypothetical protein
VFDSIFRLLLLNDSDDVLLRDPEPEKPLEDRRLAMELIILCGVPGREFSPLASEPHLLADAGVVWSGNGEENVSER